MLLFPIFPIKLLYRASLYSTVVNSVIFANRGKTHICDVKNSQLRHVLPISENDRVISSFCEGFIIAKLRTCEVSRK